jgi:hypothetical protein
MATVRSRFLQMVAAGGRWYITACRWLRLPHQMYGTELKNVMERFIQYIKDRIDASITISRVEYPKVKLRRTDPMWQYL